MSFFFIFRSRLFISEKACNICLSEYGLFHLTWWSPLLYIFLQQHNFIHLYGLIILHCVDTPHFLYPFITWLAPRLIQ
jgi:hypothetical protein